MSLFTTIFFQISNGCLIWPSNFQQTKKCLSDTHRLAIPRSPAIVVPDTCPSFKLNQTTPFHHFISARTNICPVVCVKRVDVRALKTHRKSPLLAGDPSRVVKCQLVVNLRPHHPVLWVSQSYLPTPSLTRFNETIADLLTLRAHDSRTGRLLASPDSKS